MRAVTTLPRAHRRRLDRAFDVALASDTVLEPDVVVARRYDLTVAT